MPVGLPIRRALLTCMEGLCGRSRLWPSRPPAKHIAWLSLVSGCYQRGGYEITFRPLASFTAGARCLRTALGSGCLLAAHAYSHRWLLLQLPTRLKYRGSFSPCPRLTLSRWCRPLCAWGMMVAGRSKIQTQREQTLTMSKLGDVLDHARACSQERGCVRTAGGSTAQTAVSYTHLTLPTILLV